MKKIFFQNYLGSKVLTKNFFMQINQAVINPLSYCPVRED